MDIVLMTYKYKRDKTDTYLQLVSHMEWEDTDSFVLVMLNVNYPGYSDCPLKTESRYYCHLTENGSYLLHYLIEFEHKGAFALSELKNLLLKYNFKHLHKLKKLITRVPRIDPPIQIHPLVWDPSIEDVDIKSPKDFILIKRHSSPETTSEINHARNRTLSQVSNYIDQNKTPEEINGTDIKLPELPKFSKKPLPYYSLSNPQLSSRNYSPVLHPYSNPLSSPIPRKKISSRPNSSRGSRKSSLTDSSPPIIGFYKPKVYSKKSMNSQNSTDS